MNMILDCIEAPVWRGRTAPPSHFWFKIKSFSLLSGAPIKKLKSSQFEASDLKWNLIIYPNGNTDEDGENHISIYLELETKSLPVGGEVNAIVTFMIFNQLQNKYDSLQDGRVRRFHALKREWGISRFMDLNFFKRPSNGYLINDECVFGLEVFVVNNTFQEGICFSIVKEPATNYYLMKINDFSFLKNYESKNFGDYKWYICLYPDGHGEAEGNSISIFLTLPKSSIPPNTKLLVKYNLLVRDQINGKHVEVEGENLSGSILEWGSRKFMTIGKFKDPKQGFLVDNTCIVEAHVTVLGLIETEAALQSHEPAVKYPVCL